MCSVNGREGNNNTCKKFIWYQQANWPHMAPIIDLHDDERNIVPWKWFHSWITMISMTTKETKCQSAMKVISLLNNNELHDNVRNKVPWKWFHYWITKNWIATKCLQAHNFGLTGISELHKKLDGPLQLQTSEKYHFQGWCV